ncbi:MAG: methyltransferase [Nitrospirae bacterium GWC2_57_9]|nr:MAG: methyltransferase [Nitrospirae bacterium GWC2_57_9]
MADMQGLMIAFAKLLLAAGIGGAIGFERESHGQAAGFRTYLIVGTGSCLMMLLSLHIEEIYQPLTDRTVVRLDPGRIASYAIASMGFLGAGAIIKGKGSVRGLTTAAALWAVTGIGLSIGAGHILPAIAATTIILSSLYLAYPLKALSRRRIFTVLTVKAESTEGILGRITTLLAEYPALSVQFINYHSDLASRQVTYRMRLHHRDEGPRAWSDIVKRLSAMPDVRQISWEESDVP